MSLNLMNGYTVNKQGSSAPPLGGAGGGGGAAAAAAGVVSLRVAWRCSLTRPPLFLGGRYRKLARDVPQSCWVIEGEGRKGVGSVEECISEDVAKAFGVPGPSEVE